MSTPTLLLDLHYTFAVDEAWHRNTRLSARLEREEYRKWIIDLAVANQAWVILTTARPERYAEATLLRIAQDCDGWVPHDTFFRQIEAQPHIAKEDNLRRITEKYGEPTPDWIGFESNAKTREMYTRHGIYSLPVHQGNPLTAWPVNPMTLDADPFTLP